ncbi:MAG: hypothetical protein J6J09_04695 [Phocaeicola sp.]|nr:hypothetical protein [Phocaeicola sp.]
MEHVLHDSTAYDSHSTQHYHLANCHQRLAPLTNLTYLIKYIRGEIRKALVNLEQVLNIPS